MLSSFPYVGIYISTFMFRVYIVFLWLKEVQHNIRVKQWQFNLKVVQTFLERETQTY